MQKIETGRFFSCLGELSVVLHAFWLAAPSNKKGNNSNKQSPTQVLMSPEGESHTGSGCVLAMPSEQPLDRPSCWSKLSAVSCHKLFKLSVFAIGRW